ncbi:unnamed protein product [Prorocentrum cordatum]|uniref:Uncharacterized protein n=1 Tax=Prorocentrum cordatum TaxID=2364126 RepID=A0ABN9Y048_9DINO|nr:unnamed protein product [Polarella glacialis]
MTALEANPVFPCRDLKTRQPTPLQFSLEKNFIGSAVIQEKVDAGIIEVYIDGMPHSPASALHAAHDC